MLKLPYNIYFRMPEALRTFNFLDIKRANELFEYRFNTDEIIRRSDGKKMKNVPLYNYLQIKFATIWSNLSCFQDGQKFKKWGEQASNAYYFLIYYILNQLQKKGYVDYEEVIIDLLKDERTKKLFDIYIALLLDDEECTQIDKLKLKEIKEFQVYENDLQYKEAIIDVLEKNNNFDILIIYENLPGEISIINLIKKIKNINNKINFIFILENKNEKLEKLLFEENIKNIFYNKEININNFILKIKNIKFNNEEKLIEKINNLEKIIINKNNEILNYKNNLINLEKNKKLKIIVFYKNDKNKIKNKLFLYYDINIYYYIFIKMNNKNNYKKNMLKNAEKIIIILELNNFEEIKRINSLINNLILNDLINKNKINILINKYNKKLINYKLIKNIFLNYNILGKINLNKINIFQKIKNN